MGCHICSYWLVLAGVVYIIEFVLNVASTPASYRRLKVWIQFVKRATFCQKE